MTARTRSGGSVQTPGNPVLEAAEALRLGRIPHFEPGDPFFAVVQHWRALMQHPKDAAISQAFEAACASIDADPLTVHQIAAWVHALASRDGLAGGRSVMASMDGARPKRLRAGRHRDEALQLYDAALASGATIGSARSSASGQLKAKYRDAPSESSIRDWVAKRSRP